MYVNYIAAVILGLFQLRLKGMHQAMRQLTQISKYECVVVWVAQVLDDGVQILCVIRTDLVLTFCRLLTTDRTSP